MGGLSFDPTINAGTIVQIIVLISATLGIFWRIRMDVDRMSLQATAEIRLIGKQFDIVTERINNVNERIVSVETSVGKLTDVLVMIGKQEARLDGIDQRLMEIRVMSLSHGEISRGGGR